MIKVDPKQLDKVCKVLSSFEEAHHILQRADEFDLIIMAHTSNMENLNELVKRIKSVPGVRDAFISAATRIIKVEPSFKL
jgi:DNA-binding Lrp family transcriptional regulator